MDGPVFAVHIALEASGYEAVAGVVAATTDGVAASFLAGAAALDAFNLSLSAVKANLISFIPVLQGVIAGSVAAATAASGVAASAATATAGLGSMAAAQNSVATSSAAMSTGVTAAGAAVAGVVVGVVALAAALAGLVSAADHALESFGAFEQKQANVQAASGESARVIGVLSDKILDIAEAGSKFKPTEMSEGLYALASQGYNAQQQLDALPATLTFAAASMDGLDRATESILSGLNNFRLSASDATRVADVYTAAINKSALDAGRLAAAIRTGAPAAGALNQGFEETIAVLSILTQRFNNGELAGTGLKSALNQISRQAQKLGIDIFDASGKMLPMADIIDNIKKRGISTQQALDLFGTRAGPALAILMEEGSRAIRDQTKAIESHGQAAEAAAIQLDTLEGDQKKLASAIEVFWTVLGRSISGSQRTWVQEQAQLYQQATEWIKAHADEIKSAWKSVLDTVSGIVHGLISVIKFAIDHFDQFKAALIALGAVIATIEFAPLITGIANVIRMLATLTIWDTVAAIGAMSGILAKVTIAWEGLTTAILSNPIGIIATAIGLVVYAFVRWHQELTRMKELQERHNGVMADHKRYLEELKTRTDLLTDSEAMYARTKLETLRIDAAQAQAEAEKLRKRDLAHNAPAQQFLFGRVLDENVPLEKDTTEALRFAGGLKQAVGELEGQLARLGGLSDMTITVTAAAVEESGKGFEKAGRAVENYRLQIEKLIAQSNLSVIAARSFYQATELGTAALEAHRIATARLAAEEKAREANEAAASRGVKINPDLPKILADNAEETERWAIALEKLSDIQQRVEQGASDLVSPLSDIRQQLQQLQSSRWFTVGIPPATISSAEEWGEKLTEVGFGIAALKRNLDNLNRSNPQTIALTKQLAESQALYAKAIDEAAVQLAIFRAKLEEPATTASAGAQREITLIRERIVAAKLGDAALAAYNVTLNAYNEALRVQSLLIQQVGESDIAYATRRTKVFLEAFRALDVQTELNKIKTDQFLSGLSSAFELLSSGLGGASTQMGRLAADMGKLVTAIKAVGDAQGRTNKILAAAQVVGAIGGALADLNVGGSGKPGGAQALGGKLDSNYAGIGSIVGAIVGAIVGYFTAGIGTGAGFAIGTALGTVLGGLVSKAGDSASATLLSSGNVQVNESSKQLNGAVKDALTNIFKGLQTAMASLGLILQGIPFIDVKVRDNIVRVIVGSVVRTFSSMQDAISFGIAEALKQSAAAGGGHLPEEVMQALAHTTATDLQALQSDIDFARGIANYGVPAVVQAIDKSISDFYVAMQRATSLGIDTTKVVAQFVDQMQAQKDALLGINKDKSPQEQLRADVAAFNQKAELVRAQAQVDKVEIELKKANLDLAIAAAKAQGALTKLQLDNLRIMEAAVAQYSTSLASIQGLIDGIVTISDEELTAALARLGRGGGGRDGGGADPLADLRRMIDEVGKSVRQSGMTDLQRQLDDINVKWRDATSVVHSSSNAASRAERERAEAIRAAMKLDKDKQAAAIRAANERYAREIAGIHRTQEAIDAANAARQQEINLLVKDLRSRVSGFVNTGKPGSGIVDAINQIDDNAKNLIADARALAREKGLTPAELHKMVQDIRNAAHLQLSAITDEVLNSVAGFLGDDGPTGLAGKIQGVSEVSMGLIDNLQALADKGRITSEEFEELRKRIEAAVPERQRSILRDATNDLFGQLYDLLGMDTEAAQLKYDLAIAELNAKKAELEASMRIAGYTQAQMDAVLGPLGILIGKVVAGGPDLFRSGGVDDNHDGQIWTGAGWVDAPPSAGGGNDVADAHERIQQYLDLALSPFQRSLKALNTEFDKYRLILGNTAEVQQAYALALHDLVTQQLQGLKTYLDSLNTSPQSILNPEQQLAEVQQQIAQAFALAQGGDASQGDVLARLVQQALQLGQVVFPQAGSGYRDLFTSLNAMLQQVWAMFQNGTAPVPAVPGAPPVTFPTPGIVPGSPGGTVPLVSGNGQASQLVVNFLPVIQQMQLSTTMLQGSMGRVEGEAKRGADASERAARALETRGNIYRKVS